MTKTLVQDGKIDGLVIDPWNELDATRPTHMNETEFVSASLSKLRAFAREKKIHIWLVAHPQKLYREKDGKIPIPSLYDISGSAHFFNKCDMGLCVWRDKQDKKTQTKVFIQKVRFQENGKTGCVTFNFDCGTGCYSAVKEEI
jgi:twinkle protein